MAAREHDTLPPDIDPSLTSEVTEPPITLLAIIRRLGPGLIIAGSIVGSGELIATTKTGAQAGISLLWLIIIGCLIKVFVQIELGRYTITHGETTLAALDQVPGPRLIVNWIVWFWLAMMLVGIAQMGAIVGGVGQAAALAMPITGDYAEAIQLPSVREIKRYLDLEDPQNREQVLSALDDAQRRRALRGHEILRERIGRLSPEHQQIVEQVRNNEHVEDPWTKDDRMWAAVMALVTMGLLYRGRYRLIQNTATTLVVLFTFITIGNVVSLQSTRQWHIPLSDFLRGLSFTLPDQSGNINPLTTALATFGIIGVGASELVAYPYWCLEKGYAKFTGPRSSDAAWARRAKGWLRVMHYDAFTSMAVYTVATLAFFVMGVAVLYNEGRDPDGMRMVGTLAAAYVPVFGAYARWLFLIGAITVLYSTFLVSTAGNARMYTDALKIYGLMDKHNQRLHERSVTAFSMIIPLLCLGLYCLKGFNPVTAILLGGAMQAMLLPMIGVGALYFRYTRTDERLRPSLLWDIFLVLSCIGLLIAGGWGVYGRFAG